MRFHGWGTGLALVWGVPVFFYTQSVMAYVFTRTEGGAPIRFEAGHRMEFSGNPTNRDGLTALTVRRAVVRALQRWTSAGPGLSFDYWQGTDKSVYRPNSEYNDVSSIYFLSNLDGEKDVPKDVLGLTQVWYNTDTGKILETDIVLNDRDFDFTTNIKDTTGLGTSFARKAYIENVLTHEMGHVLGLSHGANLQSTMFFMEASEQAHLSCDDQIGARALYRTTDVARTATLEGKIVDDQGSPVFGAHVQAVSTERGGVLAAALTDRSGQYRIEGLEPGDYIVFTESYAPGASALSRYYRTIGAGRCASNGFARQFLLDRAQHPQVLTLNAGATRSGVDIDVLCNNTAATTDAQSRKLAQSSDTAPVIWDQVNGERALSYIEKGNLSGGRLYRLNGVSGDFRFHVLAYSLFSAGTAKLRLLDSEGREVSVGENPLFRADSGFVNYDARLIADRLPAGDYFLELTWSSLPSSVFPGLGLGLDRTGFFVITGGAGDAELAYKDVLSDHVRCEMSENFPEYEAATSEPPQEGGVGFCGTVSQGGGGGGSASFPQIVGWLLPFLTAGLLSRASPVARDRFRVGVASALGQG